MLERQLAILWTFTALVTSFDKHTVKQIPSNVLTCNDLKERCFQLMSRVTEVHRVKIIGHFKGKSHLRWLRNRMLMKSTSPTIGSLKGWKINKKKGYAEMELHFWEELFKTKDDKYRVCFGQKFIKFEKMEFFCAASTARSFKPEKLQSRKGKQTMHDIDGEEVKSDGSDRKRSRGKSTRDSNFSVLKGRADLDNQ